MRGEIRVVVSVADEDALARLRKVAHDALSKEAKVGASSYGCIDPEWTGVGTTRGKPDETWQAVVCAATEDEARELLIAEDETRAVAAVLPGRDRRLVPDEPQS